ncbi:MAG: 3-methyl-2-oxobutanoate dehydrogenase subunit VorB [Candidatus Omnitrophica bacterium]|nr:3-methyl-2-oxobutanoate dehydrogenase subunit VorB [Candidatus Omnitrophota bacterium]MDD5310132.1 3-methyl-2-oxobutanoate dehydrogenase subunit VorB [Candidatus Omnitrophota bacterium]MDD5546291.1 3-methyl-2-oxobutanoate dehydrogenase subunit VorB [Candidatus Omnitrophota bacterium]
MAKIMMCGNEVIGEAAVHAGCTFYAGYPITPQNELTQYMASRMTESGGTFIQAESELAAINSVFGAAAAGARAMTSSSSPGISLKQEGISYLAACQLPAVIVNMMRGGPGLGNIAPSQADYFQATRGGGHGDYRTIVLAPSAVEEAWHLTHLAFDLADEYRNPVLILGDGILGQMMEPIEVVRKHLHGKIANHDMRHKPWALTGCKGRKPNVIRSLYLGEGELEELNRLLQMKYDRVKSKEVRFESLYTEDSDLVVVAYGTTSRIVRSAISKARQERLHVGMLRPVTLWPFPEAELQKLAKRAKAFLVVEMSAGQMVDDVKLSVLGKKPIHFYGRAGGGIPTEEAILDIIRDILRAKSRNKVRV